MTYGGRSYTVALGSEQYLKGKLACDCTKSELIQQNCDPEFPALKCGNRIAVVSLVHAEEMRRTG